MGTAAAPRALSSVVVTLIYSRYAGSAQGVIHHVPHEDAMGRNRLHPTVLRGDADSRALTVWSTAPAGWIFVPTWPCPACVGNGEVLTMSPHEWHFSAQYESCSEPRGSSAVRDTQRAAISIQCAFHPTRVSLDFRFAMLICTRHTAQLQAIERVLGLGCWQASGKESLYVTISGHFRERGWHGRPWRSCQACCEPSRGGGAEEAKGG